MENCIPRPPPKPKSLIIDPPSYSVPDVTLMFDSDDSLIWRPGENFTKLNRKLPTSLNPNPVLAASRNDELIERNIDAANLGINKSTVGSGNYSEQRLCNPNKFSDNVKDYDINSRTACTVKSPHLQLQETSSNRNYYPELYWSPQNAGLPTRLLPTLSQQNQASQEMGNSNKNSHNILNILKMNLCTDKIKPIEHINIEPKSQLKNEKSHDCCCCENVESLNSKFNPLSINPDIGPHKPTNQNPNQTQNQYILKVIDEQNQHILYLQRVVEKLLQMQNLGEKNSKCLCAKSENEPAKKVTSMQTATHNDLPMTKTVATNTEVSWADLSALDKNFNDRKQTGHAKNLCALNKFIKPSRNKNDEYGTESPNFDASHQALLRNNSFTLKNVQMDTVYDPPSPEPSLHINVPEFHEDQWPDPTLQNDDYRIRKETNEETNCADSPLVGESAMLYNERLRQNDAMMRCQGHEETSLEERNGVTFYNKVMINVQQILHRSGGVEKREENNDCDPMQLHNNNNNNEKNATGSRIGAAGAIFQQVVGPTKHQLQQFGISFLDPVTLEDKRRALPVADVFYASERPIHMGNFPSDLEILDDRQNGRRVLIPHHFADSHLAYIAQNSAGVFDSHKQRRDKRIRQRSTQEFSFATKQFLGKYELEND